MRKIFLIMIGLVACFFQSQAFLTYGIFPASPTINDSVYIYCSGWTLTSPAWRFNDATNFTNDTIYTSICWRLGQMHSGTMIHDTISLGKLSAGYYTVILQRNSTSGVSDSNCIQSNWFDYVSFGFWVSDTTTGVGKTDDKFTVSLHPNPTFTTITLSGAPPQSTATITNLQGQVLSISEIHHSPSEISVAHLPPGMYFCTVQSGGQRKVLRFVRE